MIIFVSMGCLIVVTLWLVGEKTVLTQQIIGGTRPVATVYFNTGQQIKIELYPEEAPNTVENFIYLAQQGFYEKTYVNRIIPGYLIQAGDPIGNGYGYPGYFIASECRYNGTKNRLSHTKGTVSMARAQDFNTEGSQFFVLLEDDRSLNGQYSAFGRVIEGLEILESMTTLELDENYKPREELLIEKIEIKEGQQVVENIGDKVVGE
ncbi:MAG: peptidylprolyl isomerase [Cellulosilyticaceae bacterium]